MPRYNFAHEIPLSSADLPTVDGAQVEAAISQCRDLPRQLGLPLGRSLAVATDHEARQARLLALREILADDQIAQAAGVAADAADRLRERAQGLLELAAQAMTTALAARDGQLLYHGVLVRGNDRLFAAVLKVQRDPNRPPRQRQRLSATWSVAFRSLLDARNRHLGLARTRAVPT